MVEVDVYPSPSPSLFHGVAHDLSLYGVRRHQTWRAVRGSVDYDNDFGSPFPSPFLGANNHSGDEVGEVEGTRQ